MLVQPVTGEVLTQKKKSLVLSFPSERLVLSTSVYNGGIREDLTAVFNYDCKSEETGRCELRAESYEEELRLTALDLGLDPLHTTGLSTAAQMKNAAQFSESFEGVTVTAIATGGIDINAVRAGDPASYCERSGVFESLTPGTINLFVIIGCRLSPGSLARALVTCTEAKAAAVQEWLIPSCYSHGIATGSGTDGTILVCNPASPIELTDAGTHAKLGEILAGCVKKSVQHALFLQTGMCPAYQHVALRRLERFGLCAETVRSWGWDAALPDGIATEEEKSQGLVLSSMVASLLEQYENGLLKGQEVCLALDMLWGRICFLPKELHDWVNAYLSSSSDRKPVPL